MAICSLNNNKSIHPSLQSLTLQSLHYLFLWVCYFLHFVLVMHLRASSDIYRPSSRHKAATMNTHYTYTIFCSFALHRIRIYHSLFRMLHFFIAFLKLPHIFYCVFGFISVLFCAFIVKFVTLASRMYMRLQKLL